MGAGSFTTIESKRSILFLVVQARPKFRQRFFCAAEMRIDLQGAPVALHRLADPAFMGMTMSHAGPGAKMIGIQFDGFLAIFDRSIEFLFEEPRDRSLVVGFGKIWADFGGVIEVFDGLVKVAAGHEVAPRCKSLFRS